MYMYLKVSYILSLQWAFSLLSMFKGAAKKIQSGCCGFSGLFGHVLKVFLPIVLPISVAGIFRGQELELSLCSIAVCWIVEYL